MTENENWLALVDEAVLEPSLPIIDTHHHLWPATATIRYGRFDLDTLVDEMIGGGHNVVGTVFMDSHACYRSDGPEHLQVVGETEFVDAIATEADRRGGKARGLCSAIVPRADLLLGDQVGEVLDAHLAASSRLRGIRHMTAFDADLPPIFGCTEPGVMTRPDFIAGAAELEKRDLSFDAWLFQEQLPELVAFARARPDLRIVLDHLGGPLGVGRYADERERAFRDWRQSMAKVAACPNVSLKLGGLNMRSTGMAPADDAPRPFTSAEMAQRQQGHILAAIELFGAERCMFESNFPMDRLRTSYRVLWNSFKRMTADLSHDERALLFAGTAARTYRIAMTASGSTSGPARS